jgi:hypothetical protein
MRLSILFPALTLGSAAFAAQLTQISNYGGSARAKPGMFAPPSPFPLFLLTLIVGGCTCPIKSKVMLSL